MTSRYHHAPRAYRVTGRDVEHQLAAIADHLDRIGTPTGDLAAHLDALTDAVLTVERIALAVRTGLDAGVIA
jgi:hypothetical protein